MEKGEYTDRDIILELDKVLKKSVALDIQKQISIHMFKHMGLELQRRLKTKSVSKEETLEIIMDIYKNPPPIPKQETKPEPVKETIEERLKRENVFSSSIIIGKEVLTFTEKGMNNLHCGNNDLFEEYGETTLDGHEDDGRIFKTSMVKRISDGKIFSYHYIWHAEWPTDYVNNSIYEI